MTSTDRCGVLDLSRSEAWVIHAALLARIERETDAGKKVDREMRLLETIESGEFDPDPDDLRLLRDALSTYLADAPGRDRVPGQSILDEISGVLA